ncbi:MAG: PspC domain-containing protein [Paludibacteraceae bacterium]|nr:PspC domain-containing protein [Paludibacteraceae bacterium]
MGQLKLSSNKVIGGVCAGIAEFLGIDIKLTRIIFVVLAILGTIGIWAYLIMWIVMYLINK